MSSNRIEKKIYNSVIVKFILGQNLYFFIEKVRKTGKVFIFQAGKITVIYNLLKVCLKVI